MTIKSEQPLTPKMIEAIKNQPIFWSDGRMCHWFFDFKINGKWITSKFIDNELNEIYVQVF
jgi:hypothetical protein